MSDLNQSVLLKESALDLERFGVRVAKLNATEIDQVRQAIEQAHRQGMELLIARCDTRQLEIVQKMEDLGFRLMDTLVYYTQRLSLRRPPQLPENYVWRLASIEDAGSVEILASQTFNGYLGHYHADRRLRKEDCDKVYSDWARRSCVDHNVSQAVILIEHIKSDGCRELAAFATHGCIDSHTWEGVLYGVGPEHQGRGLYGELIALGGAVGAERGHSTMLVSTQVTNLSVQKAWCKQGFLPMKSSYTFHAWMSEDK